MESAANWKPLLYRNDSSVSVLMYGPGSNQELRFIDLGDNAASDSPSMVETSTDVPLILDRFFAANDRSVWWIRPGAPSDAIWRDLDGAIQLTSGDAPPYTDEHFSPVVGRLFQDRSAVFWLSPSDETGYLTYVSGDDLVQNGVAKAACGLEDGVRYNGVPGDYDGDGTDEIVWYDFETGEARYWPQLPNCLNSSVVNIGKAKVAAFRITGGSDILLVYRPQNLVVQFIDAISGVVLATLDQSADASPILRDFDADGCTDILWFTPHLSLSQLWHSNCDTTFLESVVQHPAEAYPLGYGLGHGRR